jgi:hypothetical protein
MPELRIVIILALVLSVCSSVGADDSSASWFFEDREGIDIEKLCEEANPCEEKSPIKLDYIDECILERDFRRICSLPSAAIDIQHAPIYLLLASLRR